MFSCARLLSAFHNSMRGLAFLAGSEQAFKEELLLSIPTAAMVALLDAPLWLHMGLVGSYVLLLVVEALNTAMEKTIDRISLERHPLSGVVKDIGSLAVLLVFLLYLACAGLALRAHFAG